MKVWQIICHTFFVFATFGVGMWQSAFFSRIMLLDKEELMQEYGRFNLSTGVKRSDHWSG